MLYTCKKNSQAPLKDIDELNLLMFLKKIVLYLTNRLSACSTLISPFFTLLIKLILSSSLMVVISHAINSDEGLLFDFLLVLFPKIPRFNLGLLPIFSSSLEKSL